MDGLKPDTYYEVCLSAVEHSVIYYIHRKDCSEVRTPRAALPSPPPPPTIPNRTSAQLTSSSSLATNTGSFLPHATTSDLAFRASSGESITVSWNVTQKRSWDGKPFSSVRKLSYRR